MVEIYPAKEKKADSFSQKRITYTIVLLFGFLVSAIIFNALFSLFLTDRDIKDHAWDDVQIRLDIVQSVHQNQLDKLSIISQVAKEQNSRVCNYIDYDNVEAIAYILESMVSVHAIDFAVVVSEEDVLLAASPVYPDSYNQEDISYLIGNGEKSVSLIELPVSLGNRFLPQKLKQLETTYYLGFRAVIPLYHDAGDHYGYIVLIKTINGDLSLLDQMADLAESRVTYFDREGNTLISAAPQGNYPSINPTLSDKEQKKSLTRLKVLTQEDGMVIGAVGVSSPPIHYHEKADKVIVGVFLPFVLTTLISVTLFLLLRYRVFNKVHNLSHVLQSVSSQGEDLSVRVDTTSAAKIDEVEGMLRDFNQMMDRLEDTHSQMHLARREVEKVNLELEERVRERTEQLTEMYDSLKCEMEEKAVALAHQRELEQSLERARKMESLGTLAGGIAHDLNNILSGIVSYPDLLLRQLPEDSPMRGPITTIKGSGEKAAHIVQDLLTLTRRGVATFVPLNLNSVIVDYLESPEYEKLTSYHDELEVVLELDEKLPNVLGAATHLSKVLMNLVSNAAEALEEKGFVKIRTSSIKLTKPVVGYDEVVAGSYVTLVVSDNGVGIKQEELGKIFEPFFTRKKMGRSGTGLGMSVVWGCVEDHKGYVEVESEEGYGTVFTIYFPVTTVETDSDPLYFKETLMGNGETGWWWTMFLNSGK